MDIYRACEIAKDRMLENPEWDKKFILMGPAGAKVCEWLDPYFGMFTFEGGNGFVMIKQIPEGLEVIMPDA